jgi:hypothetical protein
MTEDEITHTWVMGVFALFVIVIWTGIGLLMIYSAITGKGLRKPEKDSPSGFVVQYQLRGIIGLGFTLSGLYAFYKAFIFLF